MASRGKGRGRAGARALAMMIGCCLGVALGGLARAQSEQAKTDLYIQNQTAAPASLQANSNVVFTITLTNGGPDSASGVTLTNILPVGLIFVSSTGCPTPMTENRGTEMCLVGSLTSGASATVTITAKALSPGAWKNVAGVIGNELDSVMSNNSSYQPITVNPEPLTLTSVTPSTGATSGGTPVSLGGTGFLDGAAVTLGGVAPVIPGFVQ